MLSGTPTDYYSRRSAALSAPSRNSAVTRPAAPAAAAGGSGGTSGGGGDIVRSPQRRATSPLPSYPAGAGRRSSVGGNAGSASGSTSGGSTAPCSFSGGISARVSTLPRASYTAAVGSREAATRTISEGADVTLSLYTDPHTTLSMLEVVDQQPSGQMFVVCRYSFHLITSISHANTRRGIALEVVDRDDEHGAYSDTPTVLLQLSFQEPAARERVITTLIRMWQIARQRHQQQRPPSPQPGSPGGGRRRGEASFQSLLASVRSLQSKTRSVLTDLRSEDTALFGPGGEFNMGDDNSSLYGSDGEVKAWAFGQLKRRGTLNDAASELRAIQQRRALRKATYEDTGSRMAAVGDRSPSPVRRLQPSSATISTTPSVFGSPQAKGICPHCNRQYYELDHISSCLDRRVRCRQCGLVMKAALMAEHMEQCGRATPQRRRADSEASFLSISPPDSPRGASLSAGGKRISFSEPLHRAGGTSISNAAPSSPKSTLRARPASPTASRGGGAARSPRAATGSRASPAASSTSASTAEGEGPTVECPYCYNRAPESHVRRCSYRPKQCRHCGEEFAARDRANHEEVCARRKGPSGKVAPQPQPDSRSSRFKQRGSEL